MPSALAYAMVSWLTKHSLILLPVVAVVVASATTAAARMRQSGGSQTLFSPPRSAFCLSSVNVSPFIVGLIFGCFCSMAVAWESFTYADDDIFFAGLSKSYPWYTPPIWPSMGRFFPLGHQEFRFLGKINATGELYRIFSAVQLGAACLAAVTAFRAAGSLAYLFLFLVLTTPAILAVALGLIFPERNVMLLLAIATMSLASYVSQGRAWALWVAVFSSFLALFYKEVVFIILATWAMMFAVCWARPDFFEVGSLRRREIALVAVALGISCVVFLGLYLVSVYSLITKSYTEGRQATSWLALSEIGTQIWLWALLGAVCLRCVLYFGWGDKFSPVWEGLAASVVAYASAFIILQLARPYYTAPAAFMTWMYCGHVLSLILAKSGTKWPYRAIGLLLMAAGASQIPAAISVFQERKELVYSKADAARFINAAAKLFRAGRDLNGPLRVYVLDTDAWEAGLFGNFLRARYGLDVVMGLSGADGKTGSSRCIQAYPVECLAGMPMVAAVLVIDFDIAHGSEDLDASKFESIYVSEDVGFWRNQRHARVLANIEYLNR